MKYITQKYEEERFEWFFSVIELQSKISPTISPIFLCEKLEFCLKVPLRSWQPLARSLAHFLQIHPGFLLSCKNGEKLEVAEKIANLRQGRGKEGAYKKTLREKNWHANIIFQYIQIWDIEFRIWDGQGSR